MKDQPTLTTNQKSRREFIKTNFLGGVFLATGLTFSACKKSIDDKKDVRKSFLLPNNQIDWSALRTQFDFDSKKNYLNTASLGPMLNTVSDRIVSTMKTLQRKVNTGHNLIAPIREKVANYLNADTEEIAFTRNSTEGMNIAARSLPLQKGDEVLITSDEHIGGAAPWIALQQEIGIVIKIIRQDSSNTNYLQTLSDAITQKTKVISVSHILCTTGEILPVKKISKLCKQKGIFCCIDGAQALGSVAIDLQNIDPDFYTTCGHKWLFGPYGTGILFINKRVLPICRTQYVGAYSDAKFNLQTKTLKYKNSADRLEYGTRNVPNICGLGEAIDFSNNLGIQKIEARGKELTDYLISKLKQRTNYKILTPISEGKYNSILTIKILDTDNLQMARELKPEKTIFIRGVYENNLNALRVSLSIFNTTTDIDNLLIALEEKVK